MKTIRCDICKKCEPEIDIKYRAKMSLLRRGSFFGDYDWYRTDICTECYKRMEAFICQSRT